MQGGPAGPVRPLRRRIGHRKQEREGRQGLHTQTRSVHCRRATVGSAGRPRRGRPAPPRAASTRGAHDQQYTRTVQEDQVYEDKALYNVDAPRSDRQCTVQTCTARLQCTVPCPRHGRLGRARPRAAAWLAAIDGRGGAERAGPIRRFGERRGGGRAAAAMGRRRGSSACVGPAFPSGLPTGCSRRPREDAAPALAIRGCGQGPAWR